jgi:putative ABC transport system permease protein
MAQGAPRRLIGKTLVGTQIAAYIVLLYIAGLAVRSVRNLGAVDVGFDPRNLIVFRLLAGGPGEERRLPALYEDLHRAIDDIPGVRSTTFSAMPLLAHAQWSETVQPDGAREPRDVHFQAVRWNFFETLGVGVVAGRSLLPGDHDRAAPVAVINESMARQVFEEPRPIGRDLSVLTGLRARTRVEVVGVVRDVKYSTLAEAAPPTLYLSWAQIPPIPVTFEVRTVVEPVDLLPVMRKTIQKTAPDVAVINLKTQEQQISEVTARERVLATTTAVFSVVGLLLASLGIHGVVSYGVTERTREIGIRMALGARWTDVVRLVLRDLLIVMGAGAIAGVVLAAIAATAITRLLVGVSPVDPVNLVVSILALAAPAAAGAYGPARRAALLNPTEAVRGQ